MTSSSTHNRAIPGPDVQQPFRVLTGIAVVFGPDHGFPIPAGSTWPGRHLEPGLLDHLSPTTVELLPGTTYTEEVRAADLVAGNALALAIGLMKGPMARRHALLPAEAMVRGNTRTLAGALSATREHFSKTRPGARR